MTSYSLSKFYPNPWNYNLMSDAEFDELKRDVKQNGLQIPIVVRETKKGHEIADGWHKVKALRELGIKELEERWVEVRDLSDADVRQYVRSSKIRGSRKNLMKEAEHYLTDYREFGGTLDEYAVHVGMDKGNLSRILSRNNTYEPVKKFIEKTELPATVIDEILKSKREYTLSYLKEAEINRWDAKTAKERMSTDKGEDDEPVKENPRNDWRDDLEGLNMETRGACGHIVNGAISNLSSVMKQLDLLGQLSAKGKCETVIKQLVTLRDALYGIHRVVPKDRTQPIEVRNTMREWMLEGDDGTRSGKHKAINEMITEILER